MLDTFVTVTKNSREQLREKRLALADHGSRSSHDGKETRAEEQEAGEMAQQFFYCRRP